LKVLLVVIDAASPRVVCPAIATGRLPTLHKLADAGRMHESSISIFPSITPAATASIVTGAYPAEHGIAGASWYDEARGEVAYYGDDFWVIARKGVGPFLRDFLIGLNGERLKAPTLFDLVERTGRSAASLNYLVFRGRTAHRVRMPKRLAVLPGVRRSETVHGPSMLCLGEFVRCGARRGRRDGAPPSLLHRFGMDDVSTGGLLRDLAGRGELRDLTVAYFADNDYNSHKVGPHAALPVVERVDRMLGEAIDAGGGLERFLRDTCVVVTSDHGHCEVLKDRRKSAIRLDRALGDFRQATVGRPWRQRDDLMICPNMRAAQIYVRGASDEKIERVAAAALGDPRVDQAIWRSRASADAGAYIVASTRGRLRFRRGRGQDGARDAFGTDWRWSGELAAVGAVRDGDRLRFEDYPNAFERIANVLDLETSGDVWVTANPGCEFEVPGQQAHIGGASHGALHALESFCPVIIAGAPKSVALPRDLRSIDLAPLCAAILGVPFKYAVGDPR